jgi:HEPN domain-containing protein
MTKNLVLQAAYHTQQCLEKELKGLYILFANEQARYPSYKENISKSLDAKTITNFINTIHEVYTWRAKKKT